MEEQVAQFDRAYQIVRLKKQQKGVMSLAQLVAQQNSEHKDNQDDQIVIDLEEQQSEQLGSDLEDLRQKVSVKKKFPEFFRSRGTSKFQHYPQHFPLKLIQYKRRGYRPRQAVVVAKIFVQRDTNLRQLKFDYFPQIPQAQIIQGFKYIAHTTLLKLVRLILLTCNITMNKYDGLDRLSNFTSEICLCRKWMSKQDADTFIRLIKDEFQISRQEFYLEELVSLLKTFAEFQKAKKVKSNKMLEQLSQIKIKERIKAVRQVDFAQRKNLYYFQKDVASLVLKGYELDLVLKQLSQAFPYLRFRKEDIETALKMAMINGARRIYRAASIDKTLPALVLPLNELVEPILRGQSAYMKKILLKAGFMEKNVTEVRKYIETFNKYAQEISKKQ